MKRVATFAFALLALTFPARAGQDATIESFTLANGMEVVVIPNHRVPAVNHTLWFRVGGIEDPPGKSGLAHFHEHVMFLGSPGYKEGEYANLIARGGGNHNAFTSHDATAYYVTVAKEQLPLVMQLEADRLKDLTPTEERTLKERQVIIEERRMRIENNPDALLSEQMDAALYLHYPYHIPVIGWKHEMEELTREDVLAFHHQYYHAGNAILVVSGDITAAELKPLAEKYYGGLPHGPDVQRISRQEPPHIAALRLVMHHVNVKQPLWVRDYLAPSLCYGAKEQAVPLLLVAQLLGGGKTSVLYRELVVKQKLAADIEAGYSAFALGPSKFSISATPAEHVPPEKLEAAITKAVENFLRSEISADDLARAKTLLKADNIYSREGLQSMSFIMGWMRILGLDKEYFNRWPSLIDAATGAQMTEAAKAVFHDEQSVTGLLLPPGKESAP